jgi:preprotein translocase SecE subunit
MNRWFQFFKEAYEELKKVSWLTRPQMIASTWLVVFLVAIFAVYVSVVDLIIARILGLLI